MDDKLHLTKNIHYLSFPYSQLISVMKETFVFCNMPKHCYPVLPGVNPDSAYRTARGKGSKHAITTVQHNLLMEILNFMSADHRQ